jgi:hypothetical protein
MSLPVIVTVLLIGGVVVLGLLLLVSLVALFRLPPDASTTSG